MTIRNLEYALRPSSIAVIGASDRAGSAGRKVTENVLAGGFTGPVYLVNPQHKEVAGRECFASVAALPAAPELAVIVTPPETVPPLIAELGAKGTPAVVVITAGLDKATKQAMLDAARPTCLRIIGPNCLGVWVPALGINANFGSAHPFPGRLAFLSQSGALVGGVLDWAQSRGIGFSYVVSMGNMADVDVGDLLDYLAADISTGAILLYLETIPSARKFMSASRSAARAKPVVVIKSGRSELSARAAATHTGALAGNDSAVAAAFRRAGLVRVDDLEALFTAAETSDLPQAGPGQRASDPDQWRWCGRARGRCADPLGWQAGKAIARADDDARRDPAGDLVARQSDRHHRRRHGGPLCGRHGGRAHAWPG